MNYPIVVGTDLSEGSDDTLIQAEARATRDSVPLTVVHAIPPRLWAAAQGPEDLEQIALAIREQVGALTGRVPDEFEVLVERGSPHLVLPRIASARHALLVVGSHMERGIGHALLRDVTERVVPRCAGPVLATRPGNGSGRILAAIRNPVNDMATLDAAVAEAAASESVLMIVHCVHMGFIETITADLINGGVYAEHPFGQRSLVVEARRSLGIELKRRAVDAEVHVIEWPPDALIPEIAARTNAELVVVGSAHQPAEISHVATAVLRHAPCSVLVVDTGTAAASAHPAQHAAAH
jgi:nucleotide-binding universal stress UspA family protein